MTFSVRGIGAQLLLHEVCVDTIKIQEDDITRMLIAELRSEYVPQSDHRINWHEIEHRCTARMSAVGRKTWLGGERTAAALKSPGSRWKMAARLTSEKSVASSGEPVPVEDRLSQERLSAIRARLMDCQEWESNAGRMDA
ncbi:MAG: hypothetical protein IPM94_00830 [bacterium]|nr:hypothetical protein [bacterium]